MIGANLLGPEPTLLEPEVAVSASLAEGVPAEQLVRKYPESPLAWAELAEEADAAGREIEAYAFARALPAKPPRAPKVAAKRRRPA